MDVFAILTSGCMWMRVDGCSIELHNIFGDLLEAKMHSGIPKIHFPTLLAFHSSFSATVPCFHPCTFTYMYVCIFSNAFLFSSLNFLFPYL